MYADKYKLKQIFLFSTFYLLLTTFCFAEIISSAELLRHPKEYDKKRIIYQGEVIGDIMERKDFVWINLHDGYAAIGVFIKKETLPSIKFLGSYKVKGDILEVEGIFNASCLEHGGDIDIHGERVKIIKEGGLREEKILISRKIWTKRLLGLNILLFLCIILRNLRERMKWKKKLRK